jgi:superfamily I DNA/RNA helicase
VDKLILGPPGCGKTYTLVQHVREYLGAGGSPVKLGMVSFTRKAVEEMLDRLCLEFNLNKKAFPYVKTMHALGKSALGLDSTKLLGSKDFEVIGNSLGLDFEGTPNLMNDGVVMTTVGGNAGEYMNVISRSRLRKVSLSDELNVSNNTTLHYEKLVQIYETIQNYKKTYNKHDFEDMIELYVKYVDPPKFDLLIVDEAQDLLPLQWDMEKKMSSSSKQTIVAGDDDQAIHKWAGVDVDLFIKRSKNIHVLKQSYRLPQSIWKLAVDLSKRISVRLPKEFLPKDECGQVHAILHLSDAPLEKGSWTIMARTNSFARDFAEELRVLGYYYSLKNVPSVDPKRVITMKVWERLQSGDSVPALELKIFFEIVPKQGDHKVVKRGGRKLIEECPIDAAYDYWELVKNFKLVAPKEADSYRVAGLGEQERIYIESLERMGEDITQPPRINVSTFHAMKGGEDDNCIVYLGSTYACVNNDDQDEEHRAFYVAITRARENLYLLESNKKYRYDI